VSPDAKDNIARTDLKKLLSSVKNNVHGLLEEMYIDPTGQALARERVPKEVEGGFLRTDGPLVSAHMQTFSIKLGFALYHEVTKKCVPMSGGVAARWFSNVERLDGTFPQSIFDVLLQPETLKQGDFNVSDQFSYQWRIAEGDRMALFFASFRRSFGVLAFVATDRSLLSVDTKHSIRVVTPRNITMLLKTHTLGEMGDTQRPQFWDRCDG
jgi:hypothetical protein